MRTCHAAKPIPEQTYAKCRTKCISPTHSSHFVEFLWKFDDSILRYGLLTVLSSVPSLTPSSGAWPKHISHVFVDTFMNRSTVMRIWWIQATREKKLAGETGDFERTFPPVKFHLHDGDYMGQFRKYLEFPCRLLSGPLSFQPPLLPFQMLFQFASRE